MSLLRIRPFVFSTSARRIPQARCFSISPPAYQKANPSNAYSSPEFESSDATSKSPEDLTPKQRAILEAILRVDQAGEIAANTIYEGQLRGFKARENTRADQKLHALVQEMWDQEKKHIKVMNQLMEQHKVRKTLLWDVARGAGWTLGAATAFMGKEAAMACTEAVETAIGEHYNDQLSHLENFPSDHPSIPLLRSVLQEFRDDELEHLDTAVANDAQKAPAHAMLSALIATGCRAGIWATKKI